MEGELHVNVKSHTESDVCRLSMKDDTNWYNIKRFKDRLLRFETDSVKRLLCYQCKVISI